MDLPISGPARDEIARILEQVAKEGLDHPRNLDAAIDAIGAALNVEPIHKIIDMNDEVYFVSNNEQWTDETPIDMFGEGATSQYGYFVAVTE